MNDVESPLSELSGLHEPKPSQLNSLESGLAYGDEHAGLYNDTIEIFRWTDVKLTLPASGKRDEKVLLDRVSGEARAGELVLFSHIGQSRKLTLPATRLPSGQLVAIMGPSGSGKTMLLNRLAHRALPPKAVTEGQILINDVPATISNIRQTSGYVEQQDHLIGSITTAETLHFAAKLGLSE